MQVEIWSDVVCPWCYVGKRRFEAALAAFPHRDDVEVVWRSFELDPDAPRRSPEPLNELLAHKMHAPVERIAASQQRLTALAAEEGLEYHLDRAQHGNTFDAHRLIHLAAKHRLQDVVKERLMRAYFTDGLPIGEPDTLAEIAVAVGLDAQEVRSMLDGDAYADDVRTDERRAAMLGITGVPFFVFDSRYAVSGAQPADLFRTALDRAWAESAPLTLVAGDDDGAAAACEGDECAI